MLIRPEEWETTKIVRKINPVTGLIDDDDKGYRGLTTLKVNPSPLVVPNILTRAAYDGFDVYDGTFDASKKKPGGLRDARFVVRETFARDLEDANNLLLRVFGGKYRLCGVDGFRSFKRQERGHFEITQYLMQQRGVFDVEKQVVEFMKAANDADGTFCYLGSFLDSPEAVDLMQDLRGDDRFMAKIKDYAGMSQINSQEALELYLTLSSSTGLGRAAGRNIPLDWEKTAHGTGGSIDILMLGPDDLPINNVPFDFPGEEARADYMEPNDDGSDNFDAYVASAKQNALLRTHLGRLGLTPETFTRKNWDFMRDGLRVLYHLAKAKGWTCYSSHPGGENFHFNGRNICQDVLTGKVFHDEAATAAEFPGHGNPCHTILMFGKDATAVWGGKTAHEQLADQIEA